MADESINMSFDNIILELQRVGELQNEYEKLEKQISKNNKQIEEIKSSNEEVEKVVGIEQTDKKKNVIDGGKLSSTLTTSEKKRYENIGKEFVAGAGKELELVRKAVQFKEAMSTVKNKFTEGIVKFKNGLKKAQRAGSFFGKLLIIIGLLGTIVYLFRDKIINSFPNFGENVRTLYNNVIAAIPDIFASVIDYVMGGVGNQFGLIMQRIVTKVIPGFIGTFFNYTLPNSIVNLYLGILSAFSGDASSMYDSRIGDVIDADMDKYAEAASQELLQQGKENELLKQYEEINDRVNGLMADSEYEDLRKAQLGASAIAITRGASDNELLPYLSSFMEGNRDIKELINSGNFKTSTFLSAIQQANDDKKITNDEVLEAIRSSVSQEVLDSGLKMPSGINSGDISKFSDNLVKISEASQKEQDRISKFYNTKITNEQKKNEMFDQYKKTTLTEIDAKDAITGEIANSFKNLVESIVNFLSGNTIADSIKAAFSDLNSSFNKFFKDFNVFISNAFNKLGDNTVKLITNYYSKPDDQINTGNITYESKDGYNFNAIVNIDLQSNSDTNISSLVSEVVSIDEQLVSVMKDSNKIMDQVISNFNDIYDLHACSQEYVNNTIKNNCDVLSNDIKGNTMLICDNKRSIDKINLSLRQTPNSPLRQSYVAPCLDLS